MPPPRGATLSEATPPPGEILRQHLGWPSRGRVWKKEIQSLEGVPPLGRLRRWEKLRGWEERGHPEKPGHEKKPHS